MYHFHVALGANLPSAFGNPFATLREAARRIARDAGRIVVKSALYSTPAIPAGAGPDFANAVMAVESDASPEAFLDRLHAIEAAMGRVRQARWGARVVDLDLLTAGDALVPDAATFSKWAALPAHRQTSEAPARLILPHPRLQDRAFVLVPLADIAPEWRHPVFDDTVAEMLDALPASDRAAIRPVGAL